MYSHWGWQIHWCWDQKIINEADWCTDVGAVYGQWSWQIHYRGVGMLCSLCSPVCVQINQLNVLTAWYLIVLRRGMPGVTAVGNLGVSVLSGYTLLLYRCSA